jgi:5-methyltetrahydrofolate--homocysteine methyltransferase
MHFLDFLKQHVIVLDGAMGTMIQAMEVTDADFGGPDFRMLSDLLTLSRPEAIHDIHLAYYRAGAHAVETNTFGASPMRLSEYDFSTIKMKHSDWKRINTLPPRQIAYLLSRRGAEVAREARASYLSAPDYDGRPLYVIGSIGPSNRVVSSTAANLAVATFDEIAANFHQQVLGLIDGGVDVLLYETQQDILEVKAAVVGGLRAMEARGVRLPIMCQVTVDQFSKMQIFNTDIHAALVTVQGVGIDTFGINCSIGPDLMVETVEKLSRYSPLPISVVPNAGLPVSEHGRTVFKFPPEELARYIVRFVREFGVNVVGGCCGTTPEHVRAMAEAVRDLAPGPREPESGLYVSGPQQAVHLDSSRGLIMVGERLNVRGSQKVREAVEVAESINYDALEEVVVEQVKDLGLNVIDVCMDSNVVDTTETLKAVVHKLTTHFTGAMSLDSFGLETLEAAVKVYPGRPLINSMSMEEVAPGVTKVEAVIRATDAHNPVYIGLAAGGKGPGATREEKYALARAIVETAGQFGVGPDRIFIDMNVFPVGSESDPALNFAVESLEAIPLIKSIDPALKTICGVGNLTNGLAKKPYMRKVLTSVWLDEARQRGLDAAIINPNHYVFVRDLDAADYALGLRVILERDMEAFEKLEEVDEAKRGHAVTKRSSYEDLSDEEAICQKIIDGYKERDSGVVEVGGHGYAYSDRIVVQAARIIGEHEPLGFINTYLMGAMQTLGDGFAKGNVSLPHLLKSADVMKQVMGFLEEYMRVSAGVDLHAAIEYKGTVVLGTVYQDVHSIGKDLAKTLFENYGYRAIDLGVMTPLQEYIDAAKKYGADAIGMSALLVQTSNHMITVSKMMEEQGLADTHLLIGGAPVNYRHAAFVAMAGRDDLDAMRPNVFYCPTAMDGVNVLNTLMSAQDLEPFLGANKDKLRQRFEREEKKAQQEKRLLGSLPRRSVTFEEHRLPESPWLKPTRIAYSLEEFAPHIDKRNLFSLNWRFSGKTKREKQGVQDAQLEALFEEWIAKAKDWLRPQGVISIFPCYGEDKEVVLMDPDGFDRELARFDFNDVIGAGKEDIVCAAQYFRPRRNGALDAIGVQIASSGTQIDQALERIKQAGDSESHLFLQGLSDRIAEDLAEHLHNVLRDYAGLSATKTGTRWSPGYPAMTNIMNNVTILQLLNATAQLGVSVTDGGEFFPTGTTAAVVSFHPLARYQ